MNTLHYIHDQTLRVSMEHKPYFDARDQPIAEPEPEPDYKIRWRDERARMLEHFFKDDEVFFLRKLNEWAAEDPPIVNALRGRAWARAHLWLRGR